MKAYLVKYQAKDGRELTKLLVKMTNEMTGEEKWLAGFLNDLPLERQWGQTGTLVASGDIYWERPLKDRLDYANPIRLTEPTLPISPPQSLFESVSEQVKQINHKKLKPTKSK
ncbi:MAG: hypothetical protein GBAus27B_000144 [Mycoplasmataceae bacterium]|nr:MAG: hypothetical protein GBAus27B_000144 [Mycoplasmataceae bacterium]